MFCQCFGSIAAAASNQCRIPFAFREEPHRLCLPRRQRVAEGISTACWNPATMANTTLQTLTPDTEAKFRSFVSTKPALLLGSSSSSRKAIMNELAAQFEFDYSCIVAGIDESAIRHEDPDKLVRLLAHAKADAILQKLQTNGTQEGYLITCDQVVVHNSTILEKPQTPEEVRTFVRGYGESPAETVGGVVVTHLPSGARCETVDVAEIHMSPIPDEIVEALISEGDVFYSAGGLIVEHPKVGPYVTRLEGGIDNVMGLSKHTVMKLLLEAAGM